MFALIDGNNFYASIEVFFNPRYRNCLVVVLSNNDGCVIARNDMAKRLGISMGAVAFEYMPLFKRSGVKLFSANFALYGDMSNRMMSILSQYSPIVEKYSIDESFIDLYGFNVDFKEHGTKIRDHINKWIGIRTGVGIANTKALCKVANHIAKKFPEQTGGVHVIDTEEKRIKALKWFKAEEIWGIGDKSFQKLVSAGVKNAYEFTLLPEF